MLLKQDHQSATDNICWEIKGEISCDSATLTGVNWMAEHMDWCVFISPLTPKVQKPAQEARRETPKSFLTTAIIKGSGHFFYLIEVNKRKGNKRKDEK